MIVCLFAIGFIFHNLFVWAIVIILLGSRQHALGVLGHDSAHFAASSSRKINDLSAELLCFWPLLTGLGDFRRFHLNHHRYFDTEKDPELLFKDSWSKPQWTLPMSRSRILSLFFLDLLGFGILEVFKAYWLLGKTSLRSWIGPLVWWAAIGALLYESGFGITIVVWFIALLTSFWGFFRLRTWTEHVGSDSTHRVRVNWWQRMLITPHCSWSHYEHHNYPSVPFWRRHELREENAATVPIWELLGSFTTPTPSKTASHPVEISAQTWQSDPSR